MKKNTYYVNQNTGEVLLKFDKVYKEGMVDFLEDKTVSSAAKVIFSFMLSRGKHGVFSGSQKYISESLSIHHVNVSAYIKQLKAKGYIVPTTLDGRKAYKINPKIGE